MWYDMRSSTVLGEISGKKWAVKHDNVDAKALNVNVCDLINVRDFNFEG